MAKTRATNARNPAWNRDEHILALDLYMSCKPKQPQKGSTQVVALSGLLNRLHKKLAARGESRHGLLSARRNYG
jgi:hypothetical protein